MPYPQRDNRGSRGRSSGRGGDFGRRSQGRPTMHSATCDDCGRECEVPFRPTSGKPVFCDRCFDKQDSPRGRRSPDRRSSDRRGPGGRTPDRGMDMLKEHLVLLDSKMDRILDMLTLIVPEKESGMKKTLKKLLKK